MLEYLTITTCTGTNKKKTAVVPFNRWNYLKRPIKFNGSIRTRRTHISLEILSYRYFNERCLAGLLGHVDTPTIIVRSFRGRSTITQRNLNRLIAVKCVSLLVSVCCRILLKCMQLKTIVNGIFLLRKCRC